MKKVLCIAAHADDEILGCGGTMAKRVGDGDKVNALILCKDRWEMAYNTTKVIGHENNYCQFDDQKFDGYHLLEITQAIEFMIKKLEPQIIYTHWIGDLNLDHQITARAVLTACRPLPASSIEAIYGFEICSSTEWGTQPFVPTHFEVLSGGHVVKKNNALECYGAEIKPYPHARSSVAIGSQWDKRGCECGNNYAEAFHTYRTIRR